MIRLRANGRASGIAYDTTGTVDIDFIEVDVTYDLGIDGAGRPNISIRPNTVATRVGSISTAFSGIDGFIVNIIVALANGTIRDIVANTLQSFITNNFTAVLDGLVSGLDIQTLGAAYDVPRLDGSAPVRLNFGIGYSSVNANTSRMLFGIGTRFTATAAHARMPGRAPLPPYDTFIDPNSGGRPVTVADHIGIYQQAMQAFWRGGGLDGTSAPSAGTMIAYATTLPPVISVATTTTVALDLGGVDASVSTPGVSGTIHVRAGARANATAVLSGDIVSFTGVALDEVHVAAPDVALSSSAQQAITDTMTALLLAMATGP